MFDWHQAAMGLLTLPVALRQWQIWAASIAAAISRKTTGRLTAPTNGGDAMRNIAFYEVVNIKHGTVSVGIGTAS